MKSRNLLLAVIVGSSLLANSTFAQNPRHRDEGPGHRPFTVIKFVCSKRGKSLCERLTKS